MPNSNDPRSIWSSPLMRPNVESYQRSMRMPNLIGRIATTGVTAGLGAAAAPFVLGGLGGGAAASSPAVTSAAQGAVGGGAATTGAATAARFTLPQIMRLGEIGVPAVTSLLGMRSQNRALDRQAQLEQQSLAEQLAFAREQDAYRRAEAERVFNEDQRRWETEERNTKEQRDFERRLIEEREARRAPFRAAANDALYRLHDLIQMGRRRR